MEAIVLLCDYAEAVNGKLYLVGGGFSNVVTPIPLSMSLAVRISVPWSATNQAHKMHIGLETEDGQPVADPLNEGEQVRIEGDFEVGRPAGMKAGTAIVNAMAFRVQGLDLDSGGYLWSMKIDGTEIARATFDVQRIQLPGAQR